MTTTTLGDAVSRLLPEAANPRVIAFPALAASGQYGPAEPGRERMVAAPAHVDDLEPVRGEQLV